MRSVVLSMIKHIHVHSLTLLLSILMFTYI